jgi:HK97 gp10 family phage protein
MIKAKINLDIKSLKYVRKSGMNKAIRIAFNKAMKPLKQAVIGNAPADKSNLKKSIRIKVKFYVRTKTWAGIVGPSKSFKRAGKKIKNGPNKGQKKAIRPARYAHLVNWGSRKLRGRKFLERSLIQTRSQFSSNLSRYIQEKLQQEFKA